MTVPFHSLGEPLAIALDEAEKRVTGVYQAEDNGLPLHILIARSLLVDNGGYTTKCLRSHSLSSSGMYGLKHYRFFPVVGEKYRNMDTRTMLTENGLHPTRDHVSVAELVKMYLLHAKIFRQMLYEGKIVASFGNDSFSLSFNTYPEIVLDDQGRPTLHSRPRYPGSWSAKHILVMRATLA
jgi:hypothetical protein